MIGIVLIVFSDYPEKLFESVTKSGERVHWYIFYNNTNEDILKKVEDFCKTQDSVTFFPYMENRGVARSWNEGIRFSKTSKDELTLILNDDIIFTPNGFSEFIDYAKSVTGNWGLITALGTESENSDRPGETLAQHLACAFIGDDAISKIGYFDENFWPAYFEDNDYMRRLSLAQIPSYCLEKVICVHDRSKTIRDNPKVKKIVLSYFSVNSAYFSKKWGGSPDEAHFSTPFGNPESSLFLPPENGNSSTQTRDNNEPKIDIHGIELGNDRSSSGHNFLSKYEEQIKFFNKPIERLLQVGSNQASDGIIFSKSLPEAKIFLIDFNSRVISSETEKIKDFHVNKGDVVGTLSSASKNAPFDLIIDSGSHSWKDQIRTIKYFFPLVSRGGMMAIENLETSFRDDGFKDYYISTKRFLDYISDAMAGGDDFKNLSEDDRDIILSLSSYVEYIIVYGKMCFLRRSSVR